MATTINPDQLGLIIQQHLRAELEAAAEPIILAAVADFELEARKRVAATVLAAVEGGYSMERMGPDIRILVRMPS